MSEVKRYEWLDVRGQTRVVDETGIDLRTWGNLTTALEFDLGKEILALASKLADAERTIDAIFDNCRVVYHYPHPLLSLNYPIEHNAKAGKFCKEAILEQLERERALAAEQRREGEKEK